MHGTGGGMKTPGALPHHLCPLGISALQAWKVGSVSYYSDLKETRSEPGFGWQDRKGGDRCDSRSPTPAPALNV